MVLKANVSIPILETAEQVEAHLRKCAPIETSGEEVLDPDAPIPYALGDLDAPIPHALTEKGRRAR